MSSLRNKLNSAILEAFRSNILANAISIIDVNRYING